jgi:uncharacterized protein YxeA
MIIIMKMILIIMIIMVMGMIMSVYPLYGTVSDRNYDAHQI